MNHLLSKGHRRIAFIGVENIREYYLSSFNGYMKALGNAGIRADAELVTSALQEPESASEAALRLMKLNEMPDAIFCAADLIAIYAMKALGDAGYRVPADISVCASDNIIPAQFCTPALTTVDIPKKHMGTAAVDILMEMIENADNESGEYKNISRMIPPGDIIERESVLNMI